MAFTCPHTYTHTYVYTHMKHNFKNVKGNLNVPDFFFFKKKGFSRLYFEKDNGRDNSIEGNRAFRRDLLNRAY